MTAVTSGYMANNPTTNTNKNGPATNIPPNTEAEDLIKSNKSTMQQLLDVLAQNNQLKQELLDREARLMAIQDSINQVLTAVNNDCNALYKEVNKSLVVIADVVKTLIEPNLQKNMEAIRTQIPQQQKIRLSNTFRQGEGLEPLDLTPDKRLNSKQQ